MAQMLYILMSLNQQELTEQVNAENVTYIDSFGVEPIVKEIKILIGIKNVKTNIYIIQAYDSARCGYFCIGFIDFMLKSKSLLEYTNLFSPNEYKKNDEVILKYLQYLNKLKSIALQCLQ